jgi:DNA repair protein RadC
MNVKITKSQKIKVLNSCDIYHIMQQVLLRENKIDRNKEHFWTVGLDIVNRVLYIELISIGTSHSVPVEPMQIFRIAVQKAATQLILVHNHPSGEVRPSDPDLALTDRLIQIGKILGVIVTDHLIITEKTYSSLGDTGIMDTLNTSSLFVPKYKQIQAISDEAHQIGHEQGIEKTKTELVKTMKKEGYSIEQIIKLTALSKEEIQKIRTPKSTPTTKK